MICSRKLCTGCGACLNVCPTSCVSMSEDEFGVSYPNINKEACINCHLCERICPNNIEQLYHYPIKCYAAWITDNEKRRLCASGGIGTLIAEYVINHGGVVLGTAYDENFVPKTIFIESRDEVNVLKGSKYVQSVIERGVLDRLRRYLEGGRLVAYIATPCQIAGILSALQKKYANFITVDLICHGVPPVRYFAEELRFLCKKYRVVHLTDVRFRGNDKYNYMMTLWDGVELKYKGKANLRGSSNINYYFSGFLRGVSLRENCFACKYARPERISDITIGDFIGLGRHRPFEHAASNVSSVTVNTSAGIDIWKKIKDSSKILECEERDYGERLAFAPSLTEPCRRDSANRKFRSLYPKCGWRGAITASMRWPLLHEDSILMVCRVRSLVSRCVRKFLHIARGGF